jgi:Leucine-rich repeat (LRR) protein
LIFKKILGYALGSNRGESNYMTNLNVQPTALSQSGKLACSCDKRDFALLAIAVAGLVIASIGLAIQQGWWPAGALSGLNQGAIAMIVVGGGVALASLIILSVKKLRTSSSQPVEEQPNQANSPVASTQNEQNACNNLPTATNPKRTNEQIVTLEQGLQKWVDQAPTAEEKHCRDVAQSIILDRFEDKAFTSLSLSGLTSLPPEIGNLTNLEVLYLQNNQLTSVPPEIGKLTNLVSLYLLENQLTSLPPEIGNLTNLEVLCLQNNQLTSVPPEIGKLTSLRDLELQNNQLTSVPPEIGNLTNLKILQLEHNQLTSLPLEIGNLMNLKELSLHFNQLTSLPLEIGNLTNLEELRLHFNQLTFLPRTILNLQKNTHIPWVRNPFSLQSNNPNEITLNEFLAWRKNQGSAI